MQLTLLGYNWHCLVATDIACLQLTLLGYNRHCLVTTDMAWLQLTLHGYNWHCMVTTDIARLQLTLHAYSWHCLVTTDIAWLRLTLLGYNWHCLVTNDIAWLQLTLLGYNWHCMVTADTTNVSYCLVTAHRVLGTRRAARGGNPAHSWLPEPHQGQSGTRSTLPGVAPCQVLVQTWPTCYFCPLCLSSLTTVLFKSDLHVIFCLVPSPPCPSWFHVYDSFKTDPHVRSISVWYPVRSASPSFTPMSRSNLARMLFLFGTMSTLLIKALKWLGLIQTWPRSCVTLVPSPHCPSMYT